MTKTKKFNWGPALFLLIYQPLLLIGLPIYLFYNTPSLSLIIISIVLLYLTGLSITAGYHRLYSHRAYRANPVVECLLLFFGSMAVQSSALRWSYDHRLHHAYVDTDEDPYSIKKGFWYAHFGWMMEEPPPIEPKVVADLMKNKLVMFQHHYSKLLMLITNVGIVLFVGWMLNDYLGAFVIAGWTRIFALHHFTWFINSLAHTWGDKPFSQAMSAVDNYIISMLTFGEGYHNYHHTFANDYRNGIKWYHFDPTKWLIWTLNKCGLARDLKRMSPYAIKKKMVLEHKNILLEQITTYWQSKQDELVKQVNEISDRLVLKISDCNKLIEQYREVKREKVALDARYALRKEIKSLKQSMRNDWKQWAALSHMISRHPAKAA